MSNAVIDVSYEAAADLSSYQYYAGKISSSQVSLAGANAANGIIQNDPKSTEGAALRMFGDSGASVDGSG